MKKTLTFEYSVSRRNIEGGTGPKSVKQQFVKAAAILKNFKK
jgi:argininosuccinate lyase